MSYERPTNPQGVTWFKLQHLSTTLMATLVALALLAVSVTTASAAKPPAGDTTDSLGGSCDAHIASGNTTMLADIRSAIGLDGQDAPNLDGGGIGIAVIDTGINSVDGLDGRGQIVDGPDLSFDALDPELRHRDLHGHGTSMASIIAASGSDAGDGIAPNSQLVNVRVGSGDGTVDVSQVIAAIDWITQNQNIGGTNIRVINLAYSTDGTQDYESDPLSHAVENAWRAGIVVVVAGGNDGRGVHQLGNPALNPYVIAVGAAAEQNKGTWNVPTWSSTGDGNRNPDIVAPGASVLGSAVPGSYLAEMYSDATCTTASGELLLRGSGTSQAAAVVAGSAALLIEQRPSLTPDQVKYLLTSTATDLNVHATQQGHGMIDMAAATAASTPGLEAIQIHYPSNGLGSLEESRGSVHVGADSTDLLSGEYTAFGGEWVPILWTSSSNTQNAWTDETYSNKGKSWVGGTWMGATWSGATWSGATWSGATWSGATWSGATWSGATWSGATWSGATWSGATWSGATWSGATWSGATWSGATWS